LTECWSEATVLLIFTMDSTSSLPCTTRLSTTRLTRPVCTCTEGKAQLRTMPNPSHPSKSFSNTQLPHTIHFLDPDKLQLRYLIMHGGFHFFVDCPHPLSQHTRAIVLHHWYSLTRFYRVVTEASSDQVNMWGEGIACKRSYVGQSSFSRNVLLQTMNIHVEECIMKSTGALRVF
jgi:hypothetical protein